MAKQKYRGKFTQDYPTERKDYYSSKHNDEGYKKSSPAEGDEEEIDRLIERMLGEEKEDQEKDEDQAA